MSEGDSDEQRGSTLREARRPLTKASHHGMCFSKVTWQQGTDLRMGREAGGQHSVSKNSTLT